MRVYIVQYTGGGIPYDPAVFSHKSAADAYWLGRWRPEEGRMVDLDNEVLDETTVPTVDYMSSPNGEDEWRRYAPLVRRV